MDNSLQSVSQQLDETIKSQIKDSYAKLDKLNREIEELNIKLQGKEMQTDRSENADFQIASDARAMKTAMANLYVKRIESMSSEVGQYTPTGFITLGTTVELKIKSVDGKPPHFDKTTLVFKLVQHDTSNALVNLVAIDTKVGQALLGRTAGQMIQVNTLSGLIDYSIERIY